MRADSTRAVLMRHLTAERAEAILQALSGIVAFSGIVIESESVECPEDKDK